MARRTLKNYRDEEVLARAEDILASRVREGEMLSNPEVASKMLRMRLAASEREIFTVVFLDTRHRMIECVDLFKGTIDGAEVHTYVIAKHALQVNAAAIILAHNHPSGNPEPSAADRAVTARIKQAMALLDIRVLDHFIVTTTGIVSMASRGLI